MVSPECAWRSRLSPCCHGAGVRATGKDPWSLLCVGSGAGEIEWELHFSSDLDEIGNGVLEGELLEVLGGEILVWG